MSMKPLRARPGPRDPEPRAFREDAGPPAIHEFAKRTPGGGDFMTDRERFLAVARGQQPDYIPIFGFPGAPGMSGGAGAAALGVFAAETAREGAPAFPAGTT